MNEIVELVKKAMSGDPQSQEAIESVKQAAQQGDPKAMQMAQVIAQVEQKLSGQAPAQAKRSGKLAQKFQIGGQLQMIADKIPAAVKGDQEALQLISQVSADPEVMEMIEQNAPQLAQAIEAIMNAFEGTSEGSAEIPEDEEPSLLEDEVPMDKRGGTLKKSKKAKKLCKGRKLAEGDVVLPKNAHGQTWSTSKSSTTVFEKGGCPCKLHRIGGKIVTVDCMGRVVNGFKRGGFIQYAEGGNQLNTPEQPSTSAPRYSAFAGTIGADMNLAQRRQWVKDNANYLRAKGWTDARIGAYSGTASDNQALARLMNGAQAWKDEQIRNVAVTSPNATVTSPNATVSSPNTTVTNPNATVEEPETPTWTFHNGLWQRYIPEVKAADGEEGSEAAIEFDWGRKGSITPEEYKTQQYALALKKYKEDKEKLREGLRNGMDQKTYKKTLKDKRKARNKAYDNIDERINSLSTSYSNYILGNLNKDSQTTYVTAVKPITYTSIPSHQNTDEASKQYYDKGGRLNYAKFFNGGKLI